MPQSSNLPAGVSPPHSCYHCSSFVVYLHDEESQSRIEKPIWQACNPSQTRLLEKICGSNPFPPYQQEFYSRTDGISFFEASLEDLQKFAQDGCLLSCHISRCLMKDDFRPESFAIGAKITTSYSLELGILDLENLGWEMLLGEEDDPCPDNTYTMLACPDDPAASVLDNRPMATNPGTIAALSQARGWLHRCQISHHSCQPPSASCMPTRLVEAIRHGTEISCRLVDNQPGDHSPYAALSYCWGGDQTFKTRLSTLEAYKQNIDSKGLPQGLQDAIFVAEQLGLQYIWIDALCIIQDSPVDQAIEIAQMARVYGDATVTISATRSSAVWNGFLGERKPLGSEIPDMVFELPCRAGGEMGKVIIVPITFEPTDPLDSRAWTFQERVLSPRVLDFGSLRTQWSCRTNLGTTFSDGWSSQPINKAYGSYDLNAETISDLMAANFDERTMLQLWMRITEGFTDRAITFASDKLPAIAGMADRFGAILGAEYCAGLWRTAMPVSLMWSAFNPQTREVNIVPSWSWASILGPVRFNRQYTDGHKSTRFEVDVLDCRVELADNHSPYGAVKGGELVLRAHSQRVIWFQESKYRMKNVLFATDDGIPPHPEEFDIGFEKGESCAINIIPDALEQDFIDNPAYKMEVHLVLCGTIVSTESSGLRSSLFGLVLRTEPEGKFSRVGIFIKTLEATDFVNYMHWFRKNEWKTFAVI